MYLFSLLHDDPFAGLEAHARGERKHYSVFCIIGFLTIYENLYIKICLMFHVNPHFFYTHTITHKYFRVARIFT